MSAYFFDSSALVKRYVTETGSSWVAQITALQLGNRTYVASITSVEVVSAITRKEKGNHVSAADAVAAITRFEHDLKTDLRVFDLTPTVIASAMSLTRKHALIHDFTNNETWPCNVNNKTWQETSANGEKLMEKLQADNQDSHFYLKDFFR